MCPGPYERARAAAAQRGSERREAVAVDWIEGALVLVAMVIGSGLLVAWWR